MDISRDERKRGSMIVCNRYQDKGRKARDVIEAYICKISAKHIG